MGGFLRRMLIAFDRGDLTKVPFSDDINDEQPPADAPQHPRSRAARWRPSSPSTPIPYIVVGDDGRLSWMLDAFTTADTYPLRDPLRAAATAPSTTCATA